MPSKKKGNGAQTQAENLQKLRNTRATHQSAADHAGDEAKILFQAPLDLFTENDSVRLGIVGERLRRLKKGILEIDAEIQEITDDATTDLQTADRDIG